MHAISRWHRTVYIPWLVASYDRHKGKRWLNSDPQTTEVKVGSLVLLILIITGRRVNIYVQNFFEFRMYIYDYQCGEKNLIYLTK